MKKIAVLNDLSGLGKCSLTAAIPVISVMGIQACPLPTAVLSCQTGFPSYYCDDYTDRMDKIMDEWKKLDFQPDGIYTGFLADAAQADKVLSFIALFGGENVKILVDPVMGDDGEEYPIYTEELCEKMRFLAKKSSCDYAKSDGGAVVAFMAGSVHMKYGQNFVILKKMIW